MIMTKTADCPACGRAEGHHLNCRKAPKPVVTLVEEPVEESVCSEPECEEPVKNSSSKYCFDHGTVAARNARAYQKRAAEKENADG